MQNSDRWLTGNAFSSHKIAGWDVSCFCKLNLESKVLRCLNRQIGCCAVAKLREGLCTALLSNAVLKHKLPGSQYPDKDQLKTVLHAHSHMHDLMSIACKIVEAFHAGFQTQKDRVFKNTTAESYIQLSTFEGKIASDRYVPAICDGVESLQESDALPANATKLR